MVGASNLTVDICWQSIKEHDTWYKYVCTGGSDGINLDPRPIHPAIDQIGSGQLSRIIWWKLRSISDSEVGRITLKMRDSQITPLLLFAQSQSICTNHNAFSAKWQKGKQNKKVTAMLSFPRKLPTKCLDFFSRWGGGTTLYNFNICPHLKLTQVTSVKLPWGKQRNFQSVKKKVHVNNSWKPMTSSCGYQHTQPTNVLFGHAKNIPNLLPIGPTNQLTAASFKHTQCCMIHSFFLPNKKRKKIYFINYPSQGH